MKFYAGPFRVRKFLGMTIWYRPNPYVEVVGIAGECWSSSTANNTWFQTFSLFTYPTLEAAQTALDMCLITDGYTILTETQMLLL